MKHRVIAKIKSLNIDKAEFYFAEAEFGSKFVSPYCENIQTKGKILEVGCGSGMLLSMLSQQFDKLEFEGIEPFGSGFSSVRELNQIDQPPSSGPV